MCAMPKTMHMHVLQYESSQLCKRRLSHSSDCIVSQMSHFFLVGKGSSGAHSLHNGAVVSSGNTICLLFLFITIPLQEVIYFIPKCLTFMFMSDLN